jgi:hypothetical protein
LIDRSLLELAATSTIGAGIACFDGLTVTTRSRFLKMLLAKSRHVPVVQLSSRSIRLQHNDL